MSDITLSKAVRSNLLSLQNTASLMEKTQNRLATGNKVNSALDNPTNFFTASALNSRAGDLAQLLDGMANGVQALQAADNGLTAITKALESMQSTLRQARQDKSFETQSYPLSETRSGNLKFSGGALDGAPEIALSKVTVTGAGGFSAGALGVATDFSISSPDLNGGSGVAINLDSTDNVSTAVDKINTALRAAPGGNAGISAIVKNGQIELTGLSGKAISLSDSNAGADLARLGLGPTNAANAIDTTMPGAIYDPDLMSGGILTINGKSVAINAGDTADQVAAAIEGLGIPGLQVEGNAPPFNALNFTLTTGHDLKIEGSNGLLRGLGLTSNTTATEVVSTNGTPAIAATAGATAQTLLKTVDELSFEINNTGLLKGKIRASNDNGKLRIENLSTQKLSVDGVSPSGEVDGASQGAAEIVGNVTRTDLADQFNELRDQLDKLSDDASFNGINLLRGDLLKIIFNETGTSAIDIQTKDEQALNAAKLSLFSIEPDQLDSDADIDALLATVKNALSAVRTQASTFGQNLSMVENRQAFTKNMINTLETGAANLTLADMNEEAANLLALQTRQQLSSNSLSLASQADQSVLQLLR